jgi:hypothetical protein
MNFVKPSVVITLLNMKMPPGLVPHVEACSLQVGMSDQTMSAENAKQTSCQRHAGQAPRGSGPMLQPAIVTLRRNTQRHAT